MVAAIKSPLGRPLILCWGIIAESKKGEMLRRQLIICRDLLGGAGNSRQSGHCCWRNVSIISSQGNQRSPSGDFDGRYHLTDLILNAGYA